MNAKPMTRKLSIAIFCSFVFLNVVTYAQWANSPGQGTTSQTINANIGIGTGTPGFPLNFGSVIGDKISLFGTSGAHYGLGIANYLLQIHTDGNASNIAFGYGTSASFTPNMTIMGTGNVGIGITNPSSKLEVVNTTNVDGQVTTFRTNTTSHMYFVAKALGGGYNWMTQANDNGIFWSDATGGSWNTSSGFVIAPHQGNFWAGLRIASNGNVSIGTGIANAKLDVAGHVRINTNTLYLYSGTDVNHGLGYRTTFGGVNTLNGPALFGWGTGVLGTTSGGEKIALYWNSNGQVLIGNPSSTTLPTGYKLYVQTGILTEKVKVAVVGTGNWSDYVFNDDYKLRSIGELEIIY